ncbi:MAG TPA: hypothetical protein PLP27_08835 [Crocinitomicaceae bacterium]|nr:hypothetical protein [Crocinitomicaceae bacterium]
MFRKIIETIFSKGLTAISNLVTLLITAKYLGAEGRGEMAIIILGITIIGVFQNIFSGSVLTYLIPRNSFKKLFTISSLWNLIMSLTLPFILVFSDLFPALYLIDLVFISFILGSIGQIQSALIGFEKISKQNIVEITKAVSFTLFALLFIVVYQDFSMNAVINTLYYSYSVTLLLALVFVLPQFFKKITISKSNNKFILSQFLRIGFQMQLNNISQMINYRFCYYLIQKTLGLSAVGVFSVATSLIEVIWIISRGISTIHYSKSVNLKDISKQILLSQKLTRMSFILTLPAIVLLLLLPNELFSWLLGKDFGDFKPLFLTYSLGVLALATFTILNHHFSGVDKNTINIKSSILGNFLTIFTGLTLINTYGILAGGIATSVAYLGMFTYLFLTFNKTYKLSPKWFSFSKSAIKNSFSLKEFDV